VVGGSAVLSSQGGNGSIGNNDATITADYNIVNEINTMISESNLQRVKTSVVNMEKMLIQKKLKLDQVGNDELKKLMQLLEKTINNHKDYAKTAMSSAEGPRGDDELNATLRRIIIKSLLVVLNFVYSKKYLKDVISGLAQPMTVDTKPHAGSTGKKQGSAAAKCVLEEESTLEIFIKMIDLFKESHHLQGQPSAGSPNSRAGKSAQATAGQATGAPAIGSAYSQAADAAVAQGYSSYPDFRDVNEEALYLFCSFAMSTNFSVN
jgi:hypothetical protein